jgi:hypothetical protein
MRRTKTDSTGANRGNRAGKENLCSLCSLLFKSDPGSVVEPDFDKSITDGVNLYAKPFFQAQTYEKN